MTDITISTLSISLSLISIILSTFFSVKGINSTRTQIILNDRQHFEAGRKDVMDSFKPLIPFIAKSKSNTMNDEEKFAYDLWNKCYEETLERHANLLEIACSNYFHWRVSSKRFECLFLYEIKDLYKADPNGYYFDESKYRMIKKVREKFDIY